MRYALTSEGENSDLSLYLTFLFHATLAGTGNLLLLSCILPFPLSHYPGREMFDDSFELVSVLMIGSHRQRVYS